MTKLFIVSDLHSKARIPLLEVPTDADAIVLAGDIVHPETAFKHFARYDKPVIVVAGNHDFWGYDVLDAVDVLRKQASSYDNIHVLDNEPLVIDGVRFIGSTFWASYGNLHPRLVIEADAYLRDSSNIKAGKFWDVVDDWGLPVHRLRAQELLETIGLQGQRIPAAAGGYAKLEELIDRGMFHPVVGYLLHQRATEFVYAELIKGFEGQTVVVTHHPPTMESIRLKYKVKSEVDLEKWNMVRFIPPGHDRFDSDWPEAAVVAGYGSPDEALFFKPGQMIQQLNGRYWVGSGELRGADMWIHGHVHDNLDYAVAGTRFVVNAAESSFFDLDGSIFDLGDGLKLAVTHAARRCALKIKDVVEKLEPYTECELLGQLPEGLVYDATREKIEDIYQTAMDAIRVFELEYNRALATDISRLRDPLLSGEPVTFDDPLVAGLSPHPFLVGSAEMVAFLGRKNENVLLPAYIKKQVTLLKDEMDNLMDIAEGRRLLK